MVDGPTIDLNCDLGEGFGRYTLGEDAALLRVVSSANVACGLHAGDPPVMARTVAAAAAEGVAIGAHPGYPDLQGFGRRKMELAPDELEAFLLYQVGALAAFTRANGVRLQHFKLHGALYNEAARNPALAEATVRAVRRFDPELVVMTLPGAVLERAAREAGLRVAREGFADRAYRADGSLMPRGEPGAVIHDAEQVVARAVRMVTRREVLTPDGTAVPLELETVCVHGDTPGAAGLAAALRQALAAAGVRIAPVQG